MQQILHQAKSQNLSKVIKALAELPGDDPVHEGALNALAEAKDIESLQKALSTRWFSLAIKHLVELGRGDELKRVYKDFPPDVQRSIVHYLGAAGDTKFLSAALENEDVEVRKQAVEWLAHHHAFEILREHLQVEPDVRVKDEIRKQLALKREGPLSPALEHIEPAEKIKQIDELIKLATTAFNRWSLYPAIRRKVLGETGKRFDISTFKKWTENQPAIDTQIQEEMDKLPSIEKGRDALADLKEVVKKLPETDKNIKLTKDWIDETWKRIHAAGEELSAEERKQWETKIEEAKQKLSQMQEASKGDLEFRIAQLEIMEQEAEKQEKLITSISEQPDFQKKYGTSAASWKDYGAYLQSLDSEDLQPLEAKQDKLAWEKSETLRKELEEKQKRRNDLQAQLKPFLSRLKTDKKFPAELDEAGNVISPEIKALDTKLDMLKRFDREWYSSPEAQETFVEIDGEKYYLQPAKWIIPKGSDVLPEYSRGKVLLPSKPSPYKSPWVPYIEEAEQKKRQLQNQFDKEMVPYLPARAKEILLQIHKLTGGNIVERDPSKPHGDIDRLMKEIRDMGVPELGGKFVSHAEAKKQREANKVQYEAERSDLLKRMENINVGYMATPEEREAKQKAMILLRKDIREFRAKYGHPPIPDSPRYQLLRQWYLDRGTK